MGFKFHAARVEREQCMRLQYLKIEISDKAAELRDWNNNSCNNNWQVRPNSLLDSLMILHLIMPPFRKK